MMYLIDLNEDSITLTKIMLAVSFLMIHKGETIFVSCLLF